MTSEYMPLKLSRDYWTCREVVDRQINMRGDCARLWCLHQLVLGEGRDNPR